MSDESVGDRDPGTAGTSAMSELINANNAILLSAIDTMVKNKLASLQSSFEPGPSAPKKPKHSFKRIGNEAQYDFNESVVDVLRDVERNLEKQNVAKAKECVTKGLSLMAFRQKNVILADKAKCGWNSVNEYVRDEILDDSEDERRWYRAEKRAKQTMNDKKSDSKKNNQGKRGFYNRPSEMSTAPSTVTAFQAQGARLPFNTAVKVPGPCFICNSPTHWKNNCPYRGKTPPNKISTSSYVHDSSQSELDVNVISSNASSADDHTDPIVFRGRLRKNVSFWESLTDSSVILDIVRIGYKLPLVFYPESKFMDNNMSSLEHADFVLDAINKLLQVGSIVECADRPTVVNPLTVAMNSDGKERLILDLRYVNECITKFKFKCEDLGVAKDMLKQNDVMFKFDLKSGYHHVDIRECDWQYLGFSWEVQGVRKYYTFTVLPFGLSSAPLVFTKMLRPLVTKWRSEGKRIVVYLDDGLCMCDDVVTGKVQAQEVRNDLLDAGFLPNEEKSEWDPAQEMIWLGILIDTKCGKFFVTEKRIAKLKSTIAQLNVLGGKFPVKLLASLAGQLISTTIAVGEVTRLMTRAMYACIVQCTSWYAYVRVDISIYEEITFWSDNIDSLNGRCFIQKYVYSDVIFSDASDDGYGAFKASNPLIVAAGNWDESERRRSSTWRELKAVIMTLRSFQDLEETCINWKTDNQSVVYIVRAGSRVPELQAMALDVYRLCKLRNLQVNVEWIPREDNQVADSLSRATDSDDWYIGLSVFQQLDARWGPHTVDRFSSWYNANIGRFNSPTWVPGTEGVDALSHQWLGENNWLVPPPKLIPKCINKIHAEQCQATLVIPLWKSAPFWPLLCKLCCVVADWTVLPNSPWTILKGKSENTIFGGKVLPFDMLALRFERCYGI